MPGLSTCADCGFPTSTHIPLPLSPFSASDNRFCPEETEKSAIRSVISAIDDDLAMYKTRIAQVRRTLEDLTRSEEGLLKYKSHHQSLLQPIRKLPSETLTEIFFASLPVDFDTPDSVRINSLATHSAPWNLSQVCRYWRSIVLNNPHLWTFVAVGYAPNGKVLSPSYWEKLYYLMETQLKRTKNVPISIRVLSDVGDGRMTRFLDLLAAHSEQWQDVQFIAPSSLVKYLSSVRGRLPLLRTAHLHFEVFTEPSVEVDIFDPDQNDHQSELDAFEIAPLLQKIILSMHPRSSSTFKAPWSQLTAYQGDYILSEHLSILRQATLLEKAVINVSPIDDDADVVVHDPHTLITLPKLRRLDIAAEAMSDPDTVTLLDTLCLPCLADLDIDVGVPGDEEHPIIPPLVALIQRSACMLTRLALAHYSLAEDTFVQLLELIPKIEQLEVILMPMTDPTQLTYRRDESLPLAPRLTSLRINMEEYSPGLWLDMVESRLCETEDPDAGLDGGSPSVAQLQTFKIDEKDVLEPSMLPEEMSARVAKLKEQGLDISLPIRVVV